MPYTFFRNIVLSLIFFLPQNAIWAQKANPSHVSLNQIYWDNDLILPRLQNEENRGLAGAFSGILSNNLIVAGGTNFPNLMPWEGGKKKWWDTLYLYSLKKKKAKWIISAKALPHPIAYGVSIQLENGILCIGGCDSTQCYRDVFMISMEKHKISISTDWPSLPIPLANACGTLIDGKIYIIGGQKETKNAAATSTFLMLDIKNKQKGWQVLPAWPGGPRGYAVCAVTKSTLFLFSGRNYENDRIVEVYKDGFEYNILTNKWNAISGDFPFMAGTAISFDNNNFIIMGGVSQILPTTIAHPGFSHAIRLFDVEQKAITEVLEIRQLIPVTTNILRKDNTIYVTSGEIKPGIRSPFILRGTITK